MPDTTKKPIKIVPNTIKTIPKIALATIIPKKTLEEQLEEIYDDIDVNVDDLPDELLEVYEELEGDYKKKSIQKNWKLWTAMFTPFVLPAFIKGVSGQVTLPYDARQSVQSNAPEPKMVVDYAKKYFEEHGLELVKTLSQTDCERLKVQLRDNWGKGPTEFKKSFQEDYANTKARLDSIYRTEYVTAQNEGILARAKEAKHAWKQWNAALDERTCPVCGDQLHGTIIPIEEQFSFVLESKNGSEEVVKNAPPAHVNCRCVLTTLDEDDYDEIKEDSAYLSDAFETIKLNYKCPKGTVDETNACVSNSNTNTSSNKPKNDIVSLKEEQKAIKSILLDYNRLSQPKDDSYNQLSKRLKEINGTLDSEKPKSVSVDITAPSRPALEKMIQGDPKFEDDPLPWDDDYNVKLGGTLYQIRLEGWYDDCLESRGYDKIDPDKYQDVIQSDFKQIVSDESGWGNSKENIYGYVPNVPGTTYGVTYIGRPIKTKQDSSYLEDVTNFIKLNYKCKAGTVDDSNKCDIEKPIVNIPIPNKFKDIDNVKSDKIRGESSEFLNQLVQNNEYLVNSLKSYTNIGHLEVNKYLGNRISGNIPKEIEKIIIGLDSIFNLQKEQNFLTSSSITTYRGVSDIEIENLLGLNQKHIYDIEPGKIITDPKFVSTTLNKEQALQFGRDRYGGSIITILIPKNSEALHIESVSGSEDELLINRNQSYKFLGVNKNIDNSGLDSNKPVHEFIFELVNANQKQSSSHLSDAVETIKLNYNCPDSEKIGSGTGSCGGSSDTKKEIFDNFKYEMDAFFKIPAQIADSKLIQYNQNISKHPENIRLEGMRLIHRTGSNNYQKEAREQIISEITNNTQLGKYLNDKIIAETKAFEENPVRLYRSGKYKNSIIESFTSNPDSAFTTNFDDVPPGNDFHKDYDELKTDGWKVLSGVLQSARYPEEYEVTLINIDELNKYRNKQKQNSAYLEDVSDFIKLNYKCKAGTVDDSNKCDPEQEKSNASDSKHTSETFIGFKADHDFSSKKSEILKTPRAKLVSLIDPELDNKLNNLSKQAKTLSKSEKHILSEYSLNEYININEFLTKKIKKHIPNPEELDILYEDAILEQAKENVEKLDNIFKNVSLPENIVSYRGLRDDILVENRELMEALDTPGSEVSFDCFSSSSVMPFVASNFATGYNGRLIELRLPKGSKALYIAEVSMSPSEYELLINRGTKFKVLESKTVEIMNPYKENNDKTEFKVTTLQAIV